MHIHNLNKVAWDRAVAEGENPYTKVVSPEQVAAAKAGQWTLCEVHRPEEDGNPIRHYMPSYYVVKAQKV